MLKIIHATLEKKISAFVCCKDIMSPFIACLFVFNSFLVTFNINRFSLTTCLMSFCSFASFRNAHFTLFKSFSVEVPNRNLLIEPTKGKSDRRFRVDKGNFSKFCLSILVTYNDAILSSSALIWFTSVSQ